MNNPHILSKIIKNMTGEDIIYVCSRSNTMLRMCKENDFIFVELGYTNYDELLELVDMQKWLSGVGLKATIRKLKKSFKLLVSHEPQIIKLPESIGRLTNLKCLGLAYTRINELPSTISYLVFLEELNLIHNQIEKLSDNLGNLTSLKKLFLDYNKITELPESISSLTNLTHLGLSGNEITELPESIGNLINLIHLGIIETKIIELPSTMNNIISLKKLSLPDDQTIKIPDDYIDGSAIYVLWWHDNIIKFLDAAFG